MERAVTSLVAVATVVVLLTLLVTARTAERCFDRYRIRPGLGEGLPLVPLAMGAAVGALLASRVAAKGGRDRRLRSAARLVRIALSVALLAAVASGVALMVGASWGAGLRTWDDDAGFLVSCSRFARGILAGGAGFALLLGLAAGLLAAAGREVRAESDR